MALSRNIWKILACPSCGRSLEKVNKGAKCNYCHTRYQYTDSGSLDLRLKRRKKCKLEFELSIRQLPESGFDYKPLLENTTPEVDFSSVSVPYHLTKELMSYFPRARGKNSLMLDLGCGNTIHRAVCEWAGFEYVGLDHNSPDALILGDAHALPFKDNSFEFILSIAVLEHIRYPFVMMREAYRVLQPNGKFIGTVAFLEPFHGDSFYHHTHLGTFNSLQYGGFKIEYIAPSEKWSVLIAQAHMGLFPKMPGFLSKSLVWPLHVLHKLWWKAGSLVNHEANEHNRIRNTTGAFAFIAAKEAA